MHREIQIKQFPIVTTHWWPKTRNERFVWENEQYLYRFLPLVHNHVQVIWVRTRRSGVWCVCARSGSRCIHTARQHHASDTTSVKRWRRRPVWMQREPERAHTHVTHRMNFNLKVNYPFKSGPAATSYFKSTRITQTSVRGTHTRARTHAGAWTSVAVFTDSFVRQSA